MMRAWFSLPPCGLGRGIRYSAADRRLVHGHWHFASSMTGSQIISGIITIGLLVLIFFMGLIPWCGGFPAAGIFHYMSCSEHLDRFSAGLVDTRPSYFT
ncbi:MAG: hypothetical protein ACLRPT_08385 [Akkermansia muciniphila]